MSLADLTEILGELRRARSLLVGLAVAVALEGAMIALMGVAVWHTRAKVSDYRAQVYELEKAVYERDNDIESCHRKVDALITLREEDQRNARSTVQRNP